MFGETYLAIKKQTADEILAAHIHSDSSIEDLHSALREQLAALKLDHIEGGALAGLDLASEIDFMTQQIPYPHPRLLSCIDARCEDGKAWLTTPFCSGGNLMTFCTRHTAPLAFIWHVGLQVAKAMAFLHFGVDEGDAFNGQTGWPVLCHADLYPGNILLHLASCEGPETLGNYPNVVLGDFGCAGSLNCTDNGRRDTVISDRKQDIINIGHLLDVLFKTCMQYDDALAQFIALFKGYDNFGVADCFFGKALLSDFAQTADRRRRGTYEDLPPAVVEELSQVKLLAELNATIPEDVIMSDGDTQLHHELLTRLPDELLEEILQSKVRLGLIDLHQVSQDRKAGYKTPLSEVLKPFQGHPKLREIARDQYYRTNTFHAKITTYRFARSSRGTIFYGDDRTQRTQIRHLEIEMNFKIDRHCLLEPDEDRVRGSLHREALVKLCVMYPNLRSLTLSLQFDPSYCRIEDTLGEIPRWEIVAVYSYSLLQNLVEAFQSYKSPRLRKKEIRFQQRPRKEQGLPAGRLPTRVDGRGRQADGLAWEILEYPYSITRL
ncbi:hypothetical protein KC318_g5259 [Hortaea werneckii]|nr:hypothetical protein KC334_g5726 [Hortaea werneckii]KAI7020919.1 hypothetical protein KC355_g2560 [Hortaea werneckii]KAI7162913.1 hypothetical protein KC324_g13065 [Hortaea werneckii]KAI7559343.1 hypothetical protein KC316_g13143 [Hortaea werneckii]KAI7668479.1 hypothetical protein KC318_g5259 [Hortaea werneckii]